MLATAVLIYLLVRDNPSERGLPSLAEIDGLPQSRRVTRSMSLGEGVLVVLREPNTWLLGSYAFLLFGTMTMMQGLWAVPYLMDAYGQTQQQAANRLTLWAIGLIVGCTLWGYLADRVVARACMPASGCFSLAARSGCRAACYGSRCSGAGSSPRPGFHRMRSSRTRFHPRRSPPPWGSSISSSGWEAPSISKSAG